MTSLDQLRAQWLEVVDLAVQHNCNRAVLIEDRLVSAAHINDCEALHPQRHAIAAPDATRIGTAVSYGCAHALDHAPVHRPSEVHLPDYAAHVGSGAVTARSSAAGIARPKRSSHCCAITDGAWCCAT